MSAFNLMKELSEKCCISKMARILKVSRSGYYAYLIRPESSTKKQDSLLESNIRECQEQFKWTLGQRPMVLKLKEKLKIPIGHNRIGRIMKQAGLQPKVKRKKFRPREAKNLNSSYVNLLDRQFDTGKINRAWVTDTSFIETTSGWHYLCPIMDLGNREILSWDFSNSNDVSAALRALKNALIIRGNPEGVIFHSDRGSQFCSLQFQKELEKNKFKISLSRRGNCWDNACIESFFKSLKHEWLYRFPVMSPARTRELIFEYIDGFYNSNRPHSSLNYMSPKEFLEICA